MPRGVQSDDGKVFDPNAIIKDHIADNQHVWVLIKGLFLLIVQFAFYSVSFHFYNSLIHIDISRRCTSQSVTSAQKVTIKQIVNKQIFAVFKLKTSTPFLLFLFFPLSVVQNQAQTQKQHVSPFQLVQLGSNRTDTARAHNHQLPPVQSPAQRSTGRSSSHDRFLLWLLCTVD